MTTTTPPATPLLTSKEACAYLRCERGYLSRHAAEIGYARRGTTRGRLLFTLADLDVFLARQHRPARLPDEGQARREPKPIDLRSRVVNPERFDRKRARLQAIVDRGRAAR